jgi:hypothetical protein
VNLLLAVLPISALPSVVEPAHKLHWLGCSLSANTSPRPILSQPEFRLHSCSLLTDGPHKAVRHLQGARHEAHCEEARVSAAALCARDVRPHALLQSETVSHQSGIVGVSVPMGRFALLLQCSRQEAMPTTLLFLPGRFVDADSDIRRGTWMMLCLLFMPWQSELLSELCFFNKVGVWAWVLVCVWRGVV